MTQKVRMSGVDMPFSAVTPAASDITITPAGAVAATNLQAAIEELDSDKQPAGDYLVADDLQGILDEVYQPLGTYLTPTDLQAFLDGELNEAFALAAHDHDADYAPLVHNHDLAYSAITHDHATDYAALRHDHDTDYAALAHDHDAAYSALGHDHDAAYAALDHTHEGFATSTHNHDTAYLAVGAPPVLTGTNTVWDDLVFQMTPSMQGQTAKPDFDSTNVGLLFPNNDASEKVFINVQMPHHWKAGSTVYPHVHWHQAASATPVFKIDYRWVELGSAVGSWTTGYTMSTKALPYTSGTIHQLSGNSVGIDGTGKTLSSILQLKLYRTDSAYQGDCLVTSFDLHYEIDSMGSSEELVK